MFATRDQENLIHGHQQLAASKPLNQAARNAPPKTPGNKYPKTPIKIPLHDENAPTAFGGKSVLGTKGNGVAGKANQQALVTPMGAKTRAPLGAKTTNARAKAFQTPAVLPDKDLDKTQIKPTSTRRPKQRISHADTIKLEIHGDTDPLGEREVEYCSPSVPYPAYESEDFPDGGLNYDMLKGPNLMRGFAQHYHNPLDSEGNSIRQKKMDAEQEAALKRTDELVLKAVEEMDWSVSDVPETREETLQSKADAESEAKLEEQIKRSKALSSKAPSTIASRKAASALSAPPRAPISSIRAPVKPAPANALKAPSFLIRGKKPLAPKPANPSPMAHTAATAASRSTIGYTKGRTASSVLKVFSPPPKAQAPAEPQPRTTKGLPRSVSNVSTGSDKTITPERYARNEDDLNIEQFRRLKLLSAFDSEGADEEELAPELRGDFSELLALADEEEEEFVMELGLM